MLVKKYLPLEINIFNRFVYYDNLKGIWKHQTRPSVSDLVFFNDSECTESIIISKREFVNIAKNFYDYFISNQDFIADGSLWYKDYLENYTLKRYEIRDLFIELVFNSDIDLRRENCLCILYNGRVYDENLESENIASIIDYKTHFYPRVKGSYGTGLIYIPEIEDAIYRQYDNIVKFLVVYLYPDCLEQISDNNYYEKYVTSYDELNYAVFNELMKLYPQDDLEYVNIKNWGYSSTESRPNFFTNEDVLIAPKIFYSVGKWHFNPNTSSWLWQKRYPRHHLTQLQLLIDYEYEEK